MATASRPLAAAIIGCGQIAGEYDEPVSEHILTHAHAYARHPETRLAAVADISADKASEFAGKWSAERAYSDPEQMLREIRPDIVSICTPDETHEQFLTLCARYPVQAVWCEKPLAIDERRAAKLVDDYERRTVLLAVNYLRRWDPGVIALGETLRHVDHGQTRAILLYSKGLRHSGSHGLDLLLDWFGPLERFSISDRLVDFQDNDPTLSGWLEFASGAQAYLLGLDERNYSVWELDVISPDGRYRLGDGGLELESYVVRPDPVFHGYRMLRSQGKQATKVSVVMLHVLDNLIHALRGEEPLRSTGRTALATLEACNQILRDAGAL